MSAPNDSGLMVLDMDTGVLSTLSDTPSSGYAFAWSPDGSKLGFKVLHATRGGYLQEPMVFDVATGSFRPLASPAPLAGVPSFSARGDVAFTLEHDAIILAADGTTARHDLGLYVNLVALSPDGTLLAYNDVADAIWVLDLRSGRRR
ncbi:MAG: TolB family protein, partial [Myxococcota bacterium]